MKSSLRVGTLVALSLFVPVLIVAQQQSRTIFISAVDQAGAPVLNLTAADFEVREGAAKKTVTFAGLANGPMRIILLIDTSASADRYQGQMKSALTGFIDTIPEKHEIGIMSTGRQFRVRLAPTTDRAKLKDAANKLSLDGGGMSFFDSLREIEPRFLKKEGVRWPVYVMFVSDGNESGYIMQNDEFVRITTDMMARGTTIHAAVVENLGPTPLTDIASRLSKSTGGALEAVPVPTGLPDKMKAIAARIVSDAENMSTRYQIEYTTDAKYAGTVDVVVLRDGVKGRISLRRPF